MSNFERIKEFISYDRHTGVFTWLNHPRANHAPRAGKVAGSTRKNIYNRIRFCGELYAAHRLAWFFVYNRWPLGVIDHINGDPSDNRIVNLRDVTHLENMQNTKAHRRGKLLGASLRKGRTKWESQVFRNGKATYLGSFKTEKEAHEAYKKYTNEKENIK